MIKRRPTLAVTAVMLVISILLLTTASLAWFTMSTSPEISGMQVTLFADRALLVSLTGEENTFTQSIDISELFENLAPLKPISTYDGVYWFLPAYNADGSLTDAEFFPLATEENMNVSLYDEEGNPLTGKALFEAQNKGYYVSCTFWLATELEEDVTVTLSAPDINLPTEDGKNNGNNLEKWETDPTNIHSFKYGSYVLPSYLKDTFNGTTTARPISNNAQTALRVGFMVEDFTAAADTESSKFTIYEPNADLRSLYKVNDDVFKPTESNGYVNGYQIDQATYQDKNYIPTLPIKVKLDEQGEPVIDSNGRIVGEVADYSPENLIVQLAGKWDTTAVEQKVLEATGDNRYIPNSGDVASFGKFITSTSDVAGTSTNPKGYENVTDVTQNSINKDLASSTQIVELQGRTGDTIHPKKITMYIWVEGQDVDCWNDVANGTFVLNLEFAARELLPKE